MTARDRALAAIVDTFVPGGDGPGGFLPSASQLGVHRRLWAEVESLGRPSLSGQLKLLLRVMETRVGALAVGGMAGRPVPFSRMSRDAREAYMRALATSPVALKRTAFQDLKRLTLLLTYGIEDSPYRAAVGYVPPKLDPPSPSAVTVRTPKAGEVIEADAVVIGSGAGGGVAAAILAVAGRKVIVLERAAMVAEDRFGGPELDGIGDLFLDRGLAATSDRWFSIRAGSAVGGGTVVNWSTSLRPPVAVRAEWAAAGIGDDLDAHFEAVERDLHVTLDESMPNGPNARLAAGLAALGYPVSVVPRNVRDCTDCGPCAVGCRSGAKQSVLRTYLADACARGAEILDRSEARRILVEGGRATGVVANVPGGQITVRAPLVALAGGSVLSPAVLLRSGIATAQAGRNLHIHPVSAVAAMYPDALEPWAGVPQGVMSEKFAEVDGAWGYRLEAAPTHPGLIATAFPWSSPDQHRALAMQAGHVASLIAIVRDRSTGRVSLARDGGVTVRYSPGAAERALLRAGMLDLARIHREAGATRIVTLFTPPLDWQAGVPFDPFLEAIAARPIAPNRVLLFTAHQMSTCRIGTSPKASVADPSGEVWGTKGLFVTDASALPSPTGVNPMLAIMALARRTASVMADQ
jgi:choline dehydrogenase-like flavoprotein